MGSNDDLSKIRNIGIAAHIAAWEANDTGVLTGSIALTRANILGATAADIAVAQSFDLEFVILPKRNLVIRGIFDAGAVLNAVTATVSGWLLPRGNINV